MCSFGGWTGRITGALLTVGLGSAMVPSAFAGELPKGMLDAGGLTLDFAACSARRFDLGSLPTEATPGNLLPDEETAAPLPNGDQRWHKVALFHHETLPSSSPLRKNLAEHVIVSREGGLLSVVKDDDLVRFCASDEYKNLHCRVEGAWTRYVRLADAKGGAHRLSFRYRMTHTRPQIGFGTQGYCIVHAWTLKPDGKGYEHVNRPACLPLKDTGDTWSPTVASFDLPEGADVVSINLRHDGVGELQVKDVYLARAKTESAGVTIRLSPAQLLDGAFAVSAGQCAQLTWEWRRDIDEAFNVKDSEFRLALPVGFDFVGDTFAKTNTLVRNADGSSLVTFRLAGRPYGPSKKLTKWNKPAVLVRATGVVGTDGVCSLSAWRKGEKTGDSGPVRLYTVPMIKTASPQRYLYAAMPGAALTTNFRQEEACVGFMNFLTDIGVRHLVSGNGGWIDGKHAETYKRVFREGGGRCITPCWSGLANGYHIGNGAPPEGDRFVSDVTSGDWLKYVQNGVCPLAVIEERPYIRDVILPELAKRLKDCNGLRANWEPFMFSHHGCYCEKCRAKFARWAKVDEAELVADWPKAVKPEGKYGKPWTRFRSLESAEVIKTFHRHVMALTGEADSFGFIPAISWRLVNSNWREDHPCPESEPIDYGESVATFGTWGPYVYWDADKPFVYAKRLPLLHYLAAKDMREQTDRDYPAGKRPRLLGGTQGLQCGEWIVQPEWLEMAMDAYFFNGFAGTQAYFFPEGYDARYAAAYARSAARAAKYETAVLDGTRNDAAVTLQPVAEYARPATTVTVSLPKAKNVPMLQHAAYDGGGVRTVAVFNFWERGAAYFDLRTTDLASGSYVVVDEDGILYAKDERTDTWTAAELAAGIRLQTGAARTRVFAIRPATADARADVKSVLTSADLAEAYRAALPGLKQAADEDAAYEKAEGAKVVKDAKAEI